MHSANAAPVVTVVAPGLTGSGRQLWCERCGQPHDPTAHFDRFQFDDAGFYPTLDVAQMRSHANFGWNRSAA